MEFCLSRDHALEYSYPASSMFQTARIGAILRRRLHGALMRAARALSETEPAQPVQLPFDPETQILWDRVKSRTMTGIERIDALRALSNISSIGFRRCGSSMMAVVL